MGVAPAEVDLHALVSADPARARLLAGFRLAELADDDFAERARVARIVGLAERELGDLARAEATLREAVDLALRADEPGLAGASMSSLGFVVARRGRLDEALRMFADARPLVTGLEGARLLNHLGVVQYWQGDLVAAAATLKAAGEALAEYDPVSEAKARSNLGVVLAQLTRFDESDTQLRLAIAASEARGLDIDAAAASHNLGITSLLRSDMPAALERFTDAERRMVAARAFSLLPRLWVDNARALGSVGLVDDAAELLRNAIDRAVAQDHGVELAVVRLALAELLLAARSWTEARTAAAEARDAFRRQRRQAWAAVAASVDLQARVLSGQRGAALLGRLRATADALEVAGWIPEATRSRLVAARADVEAGRGGPDPALRRQARSGRAVDRILLAQVEAIQAARVGDAAAARRAIDRGLRVATESQAVLGSIETRAHAAAHGHELVELGARLAVADGRPRELLARIEATRVISSRVPAVRPPADPEMAALLAELRGLDLKVADPSIEPDERQAAVARRTSVERQVRRHSRTRRGDGAPVNLNAELREAIDLLGDRQLLAHAALDGRLHAVSVIGGRSSLHDLGSLDGVRDRVEGVAFALNRLNRGQGSEASRLSAAEMLFGLSDELAELLIPPAVADSFDPVVVVPTAVLHDVPWGLLPPLAGRAVSVNASFTGWARAERARRDRVSRSAVGFVAGPGLEFADVETNELASYYPSAAVLTGAAATGERCLDLFGAADLVHVACHGTFRTDNPLFSSIHVADGPLNVYDFERVEQLPDTVVLSACSVAGSKVLQGGSILGLATALTTLGASTVIAPLTPVSDAASVTVMQRLHQGIVAGDAPASALAAAILSHDIADPTAAAFIALGA